MTKQSTRRKQPRRWDLDFKNIMDGLGITIDQLAADTGMPRSRIFNIYYCCQNDPRSARFNTVATLLLYFDIDLKYYYSEDFSTDVVVANYRKKHSANTKIA